MLKLIHKLHLLIAHLASQAYVQRIRHSTLLMTIDLVSTDLLRSALDDARELSNETCGQTTQVSFPLAYQ